MGRFIIDADTRRARKSVGDPRRGASSVASEYFSSNGVEFARGRARSDGLHHGLAGFGDNTTSTKECVEIFLLVNRHWRDSTPGYDAPSRQCSGIPTAVRATLPPGLYQPTSPSTSSRMRSAWPLWRAYSSIM